MIVYSVRMAKLKRGIGLILVLIAVASGIFGAKELVRSRETAALSLALQPKAEESRLCDDVEASQTNCLPIKTIKAKGNDERILFLNQYGWKVGEEATEIKTFCVPKEFSDVYKKYNELQRKQGYNLEKYKGKTAKVYTYKINNYPNYKDNIYAHIIIYKNKVIGGDVASTAIDGFMHGFKPENNQ